jgi:uncharacterized protein (DUF58 family)
MQEIIIKSRKKAFSLFAGNRHSKKHGDGLNFEELREYQIGDNVKRIDYNITAKKQKPYVKVFSEDKELNIIIVGLIDYKTYFGSSMLKSEKILEVVSTLGFSGVKSDDRVAIEIYSKQNILIKPTKKHKLITASLSKFIPEVMDVKLEYKKILDSLIRHKKNSVLIIISDFFIDYDFKKLGAKFDTYCVIVRDKLEEDPSKLNGLTIIDPISHKSATADFDKSYKAKLLANDTKLISNLKKANIRYMKLYTDDDISKLRRIFG